MDLRKVRYLGIVQMSHSIVRDVLHAATGLPYCQETNGAVWRIVWEAVLSEMNFLLSNLPEVKTKENEALSDEFFCRILAFLAPNRSCLSRLVQKLIAYDDVIQHKDTESSSTKLTTAKTSSRKAAVHKALESLGLSAEELRDLTETNEVKPSVKRARLLRGNVVTEAMKEKEYLAYADARRSSFPFLKPQEKREKKNAVEKLKIGSSWFDRLRIPAEILTPLLQLTLSFLANEMVFLIVDFVHVIRMDQKNDTFLRYKLLQAAARDSLSEINIELFNVLSLPLRSVATVDEVRNIFRIFSSAYFNPLDGARKSRRSLFSYF
ncbi:hypothetical protein RvY_15235 [Ramazzottius varieornatus]|uniref:Uncharacterized protein n=1 Tax=Ramazzottius varieornatus TaxID=947166 RepID=A0A1D1VU58_RAMVA|nr:hypothetical protein RvY_15235 [Ramazzottius varieornatus]